MASVLAQSVVGVGMSMIRCDWCERLIDSDGDPDCFIHDFEGMLKDEVLCEWCRDKREREQNDEPPQEDA